MRFHIVTGINKKFQINNREYMLSNNNINYLYLDNDFILIKTIEINNNDESNNDESNNYVVHDNTPNAYSFKIYINNILLKYVMSTEPIDYIYTFTGIYYTVKQRVYSKNNLINISNLINYINKDDNINDNNINDNNIKLYINDPEVLLSDRFNYYVLEALKIPIRKIYFSENIFIINENYLLNEYKIFNNNNLFYKKINYKNFYNINIICDTESYSFNTIKNQTYPAALIKINKNSTMNINIHSYYINSIFIEELIFKYLKTRNNLRIFVHLLNDTEFIITKMKKCTCTNTEISNVYVDFFMFPEKDDFINIYDLGIYK